ncbi:hypothetical protein [Saccharothrix sp.]|uniref:SPW repeat domain-containing protein n=1 Tax=Saccharothrix sp. TaxID=1873460 RepID=UPI002810AC0F|nr:hypothetical protein [Saccharothrix sp.]
MTRAVLTRRHGDIAVTAASGVGAAVGLWLMVAPLVLGYSPHSSAAWWSDLAAGGATVFVSVCQVAGLRRTWPVAIAPAAVACWLLAAPTALDLRATERAAAVNDLLAGAMLFIAVLTYVAGVYVRDVTSRPMPRASTDE